MMVTVTVQSTGIASHLVSTASLEAAYIDRRRKAQAVLPKLATSRGIGVAIAMRDLLARDYLPGHDDTEDHRCRMCGGVLPTEDHRCRMCGRVLPGVMPRGAWEVWVDRVLPGNQAVAIYAVSCEAPKPSLNAIRFQSAGGGATFTVLNMGSIYRGRVVLLDTVLQYGPTDTLMVSISGARGKDLGLNIHGLVVEPDGATISRQVP